MTKNSRPEPGQKIESILTDESGATLYRAELVLEKGPNYDAESGRGLVATLLSEEVHDPPPQTGDAAGADTFEVLRWLWDFIKENKPNNVVDEVCTTALADGHPSQQDYEGAREMVTGKYTWRCIDVVFKWEMVKVVFDVHAFYQATPRKPEIPAGDYLALVYTHVHESVARWPLTVNAKAKVMTVVNAGHGRLDPRMDVKMTLTAEDFVESLRREVIIAAQGTRGVWFKRSLTDAEQRSEG